MSVYYNYKHEAWAYGEGAPWLANPVPSIMYLGRPNNRDCCYGRFAIDEWWYFNRVVGSEDMFFIMFMKYMTPSMPRLSDAEVDEVVRDG